MLKPVKGFLRPENLLKPALSRAMLNIVKLRIILFF
jgi:hypothetical protein